MVSIHGTLALKACQTPATKNLRQPFFRRSHFAYNQWCDGVDAGPLKVVERLDLPGTPVVRVRFHLLGDTPHQQVAAGGFSRTLPHKPLSTSHFFQAYGYECRQSEDKRLGRTIEDIVLCERASLFSIASSSGVHLIVDTLSFLHCQDIQRSRLLSWTGFGYPQINNIYQPS